MPLVLFDRNHGYSKRKWYAPSASSDNTIAEISNVYPPTMISNTRMRPKGRTDRVLDIRSQNEQASQFWMPKRSHVLLLMMLTPDPPSIKHPGTSCPLMITVGAGLWWSITINPYVDSAKIVRLNLVIFASISWFGNRQGPPKWDPPQWFPLREVVAGWLLLPNRFGPLVAFVRCSYCSCVLSRLSRSSKFHLVIPNPLPWFCCTWLPVGPPRRFCWLLPFLLMFVLVTLS